MKGGGEEGLGEDVINDELDGLARGAALEQVAGMEGVLDREIRLSKAA